MLRARDRRATATSNEATRGAAGEVWGAAPAAALADRLFGSADAAQTLPFWADGGDVDRPPYAPGGHVLAAMPDHVERISLSDLRHRELVGWLDQRLPAIRPGAPRAPLTVLGLAYDAGRNLERIASTAVSAPLLPDVVLMRYPAFIQAPGAEGPWSVHAVDDDARQALLARLSKPPQPRAALSVGPLTSSMSRQQHRAALTDVIAGIEAGDLYQANVARRLQGVMSSGDVADLYAALRAVNPASFGCLWAMDPPSLWLASSSPECLLRFDPSNRVAHSYPIKGTRPRAGQAQADDALARELAEDPKERAEHVMIVDLVRNDLGRVAETGSVAVDALFDALTLPTVHHLVSDIRCTLRADASLADLIAATFPGGSITGAPKIAAMNRIEAVEGLRRGFYTGSVGLCFGDGELIMNILIRSAIVHGTQLLYQTGGGIVADSDPDREWAETEAKAAAFQAALAGTRG